MTDTQLNNVVAGWNPGGNLCGNSDCANNGWGNGWGPINPGSPNGDTSPSKLNNGSIVGFGSNNLDPSNSGALAGR